MHFEVTHSKMNEGKGYMGETKARVERSYKLLNEVYNSGMFNGGSFGSVGNSMGVLLQRLAAERNECAMLENGLASIANIYLNLDSTLTGNSLMDNVTPDTQLDPDVVESITSVYSGGGDAPGKNVGRHARKNVDRKRNISRSGGGGHRRGENDETYVSASGAEYTEFVPGYVYVDDMDFLPLSDTLYKRLYVDAAIVTDDTGNKVHACDQYGNPIYGLANLHGTLHTPEGYPVLGTGWQYLSWGSWLDALGFKPAELLLHYFDGNGEDYIYDARPLLTNSNIRQHYETNLNNVIASCEGNIADGETVIIATSPSDTVYGCDGWDTEIGLATNMNASLSVNQAEAGIVCEISRDGDHYTMNYNYYIVDYYDFDNNPEDLYDLNRYGIAENYLGYGKISGTIEWDAGDY